MKNIDTFIEAFKEIVRRVRMQPRVRDVVRERLVAYADLHAVREAASRAKQTAATNVSVWTHLHMHALRIGFAAVVAVVGTGGIALASENTLPGDVLYPVKIGFVEPLESAVLVDAKSKATWSAILAERRLTEAALLASTDTLDEQKRIMLEDQFELHVDRASTAASEVRAKGDIASALAVRSDLEARLVAHADIFAILSDTERAEGEPASEVGKLQHSIAVKRDIISAERMESEREASERMFAYGSVNIDQATEITEDVARLALSTGGAVFTEIDARISGARDALSVARDALSRKEDGGAYVATQTATRLAHEASILNKNRGVLAQASANRERAMHASPAAGASAAATASTPADEPQTSIMMMKLPTGDALLDIQASTTSTSTDEDLTEDATKNSEKSSDASKTSPETQEAEKKAPSSGSMNVQVGPVRVTVPSILGF